MTREEAIRELREDKALYETDNCHAGDGSPDGDLLEAIDMAIEELSERTGKWTLKMNERFYWKECSVCGHKPPRSDEYGTYIESNFCPNCGAKMDGGGDAE